MKKCSYVRESVGAASSYVDFSELPLLCLRNFLFLLNIHKCIVFTIRASALYATLQMPLFSVSPYAHHHYMQC